MKELTVLALDGMLRCVDEFAGLRMLETFLRSVLPTNSRPCSLSDGEHVRHSIPPYLAHS